MDIMRRSHAVTALLFLALLCPSVLGDSPVTPDQVGFQRLSVEHGLSQSCVRAMIQDSAGFIWLGTEDGLNRFDGYTFTVYRHDPEDPDSLAHDQIQDLCEGKDGSIWVATMAGLDRLDRSSNHFTHHQAVAGDPRSLSHDLVLSVHRDSSDRIWVGTAAGLDRHEPADGSFSHHPLGSGDGPTDGPAPARRIFEDSRGDLWVGTNTALYRIDRRDGTVTGYGSDPSDPSTLSSPFVLSLCEDSSGMIWVGTTAGLNLIDPSTGRVTRQASDPLDPVNLGTQPIAALLTDSTGMVWVGTLLAGVCTLEQGGDTWKQYSYSPGDPTSLSLDFILSMIEDRSGLIWVGTNGGGLNIFDREKKPFIHHTHIPGDPDSIQHLVVRTITGDHEGNLWIGLVNGGMTRIDSTGRHHRYLADPNDPDSLSLNTVWYAHVDRRGTVWAATAGNGLDRYRPETDDFAHYRPDPQNPSSISFNVVQYVREDRSGRLWIGTGGGGVNLMDRETGTFTRFLFSPDDPTSLSSNGIYCIAEDSEGAIWVGTNGGGLNHYDEETGVFTRYRHDPVDPESISDNRVLAIHPTPDGLLWLGTGLGLNRFDPATGKCRRYYAGDGLPNNVIYAILPDEAGNFWISTNHGICRFTPHDGDDDPEIRTYDMSDGLQSNEFNSASAWLSPDGEMFFGGINGYTSFRPEEISENSIVPTVALTRIMVPDLDLPNPQPLSSRAAVTLPYRHNDIHVQFSALSFRQPEKNRYAYRLEGLEEQWTEAGTRRHASYTNLDPGHYTLRVRASNNDGVWNEEGATLAITVIPPFWQRGWFLVLAALVLTTAAIAAYRHRMRVVSLRAELQTARDTQASILPQAPPVADGYDIAGTCIPANTVGGDFYDFIWLDEQRTRLGIAVADVAGKSMDAALTAVLTTGVVQAEARRRTSTAEVVAAANRPLYLKTARNSFTALCFARITLADRQLAFTNAGLMEPLLKRAGSVRSLRSIGSKLPLGVLPEGEYAENRVPLEPGDLLLFFTDGIPDSQDPSRAFYETEALHRLLAELDTERLGADEVLSALIHEVRRFSAGVPQQDDITAVAVKVL